MVNCVLTEGTIYHYSSATLSDIKLLDTELLIHEVKPAGDKSPTETQMILNHKDAIEFLVDPADEIGFNRHI
ncbi:hypothetical protein FAZ15_21715 [Sphingobacterium olei]|uniref:Uncharacterized protein n=1 Tax=Sphingobacterium olei TaxID=2571155 RepID=A0A4U0N8F2_9SPHI|nr:hypothetical protein [Sphingobacterium olei]TJZ50040.1 hypothetical protein FAZ15_21715 [Sphingobacterium olei]